MLSEVSVISHHERLVFSIRAVMTFYADRKYTLADVAGSSREWFVYTTPSLIKLDKWCGGVFRLARANMLVSLLWVDQVWKEKRKIFISLLDGRVIRVSTRNKYLWREVCV